MAFPVVGSRNNSVEPSNTNAHTVDLPASLASGDGILIGVVTDGGDECLTPAGWSGGAFSDEGSVRITAFYKKSDGGEGATVEVTSVGGGGEESCHRSLRITAASTTDWDVVPPQFATGPTGVGANPDPPALNPTWQNGDDTLWIAAFGGDDDEVATGYPANYGQNQVTQQSSSGAGTCVDGWAERELSTGGEENPGTFTFPTDDWAAITIAIPPSGATPPSTDIIQQSFRWRDTDPTGVNANGGGDWAAAKDVDVTEPIQDVNPVSGRLRIGLRNTSGGTINVAYELWYSKDSGTYQIVDNVSSPWATNSDQREVALVPSSSYTNGASTTELLADAGTFVTGEGRETNPTGSISLDNGEDTELEFKLLFRKWSEDGHAPDGTTFDFQVRDSTSGQILGTYTETPRLTIGNQPGHIGGAVPETPGDLFVVEDTGVLYAVIEATDRTGGGGPFENELIVMKSTDGGDTWTAPDLANRPGTTYLDMEALDLCYVAADDRIYIAFQGPSSDSVYYLEFNTSGHASPDEYGTVEAVDTAPPVPIDGQGVGIRRRPSDNVTWVAYKDGDGTNARVSLKKRTSGGDWDASPTDLDGEASQDVHGAWLEIDSGNVIHIVYLVQRGTDTDADLYHRSISTGDSLSGRNAINDVSRTMDGDSPSHAHPHVPPRVYDDGATEKVGVVFIDTGEDLFFSDSAVSSISFVADEAVSDADVASSAGGSFVAQAALAWDDVDDEPVVVFVDETDETLLLTDVRVSGSWGTDATELDAPDDVGWVRARVFTHSSGNGGNRVVGILYDQHPAPGGTGGVKYREIFRASSGVSIAVGAVAETEAAVVVGVDSPITIGVNEVAETEVAQAVVVASSITVSVGPVAESESVGAVAPVVGGVSVAVGQVGESEVAIAAGVSSPITVGVAAVAEVETLVAVAPVVGGVSIAVDVAPETETAQAVVPQPGGVVIPVGVVAESESAQPVTIDLTTPVGSAAEVETAQPVTLDLTVPVSASAESEAAGVVAPILGAGDQSVGVGQAGEVETAQGVVADIEQNVVAAQEAEAVVAVGVVVGGVSIPVGSVAESETAGAVVADQSIVVGLAAESEIAVAAAVVSPITVAVNEVAESESAQSVVPQAGSVTVSVGAAAETESAVVVDPTLGQLVGVGPVAESEAAQPVVIIFDQTIAVGSVSEVETAKGIFADAEQNIVTAQESEAAQPVGAIAGAVVVPVGEVSESETAQEVGVDSSVTVGVSTAEESETVEAVGVVVVVQVGTAAEVETALEVFIPRVVPVGVATETEGAGVVSSFVGQPQDLHLSLGSLTLGWEFSNLDRRWEPGKVDQRWVIEELFLEPSR